MALAISAVEPDLASVKARLNKTSNTDDAELTSMLNAALAEYEEWLGPITNKTLRYDGGGSKLILPRNATAVTAVSYTDGTVVPLADLDFDAATGILHWGYGTAGRFPTGSRNVVVTFTVSVPAHHVEAIIADVAGYFASTQRATPRASLPGEGGYASGEMERTSPVVLFPRIRALAKSYPAIA